jgi:hypothetical protein
MRSTVRTLSTLSAGLVLAPERYLAAEAGAADGTPLGSFVVERAERAPIAELDGAIVLDTTHAKDGLVDVGAALRTAGARPKSAKKLACPGDLLVSRLRPYLRQIALVTPELVHVLGGRAIACSPEFFVLRASEPGASLAWLVPLLLSDAAQAALAGAQEGGHHPRVPRDSLLGLRVATLTPRARAALDAEVVEASREVSAAEPPARRARRTRDRSRR